MSPGVAALHISYGKLDAAVQVAAEAWLRAWLSSDPAAAGALDWAARAALSGVAVRSSLTSTPAGAPLMPWGGNSNTVSDAAPVTYAVQVHSCFVQGAPSEPAAQHKPSHAMHRGTPSAPSALSTPPGSRPAVLISWTRASPPPSAAAAAAAAKSPAATVTTAPGGAGASAAAGAAAFDVEAFGGDDPLGISTKEDVDVDCLLPLLQQQHHHHHHHHRRRSTESQHQHGPHQRQLLASGGARAAPPPAPLLPEGAAECDQLLLASYRQLAVETGPHCVTVLEYPGRVLYQNDRSRAYWGPLEGKPLGAALMHRLLSPPGGGASNAAATAWGSAATTTFAATATGAAAGTGTGASTAPVDGARAQLRQHCSGRGAVGHTRSWRVSKRPGAQAEEGEEGVLLGLGGLGELRRVRDGGGRSGALLDRMLRAFDEGQTFEAVVQVPQSCRGEPLEDASATAAAAALPGSAAAMHAFAAAAAAAALAAQPSRRASRGSSPFADALRAATSSHPALCTASRRPTASGSVCAPTGTGSTAGPSQEHELLAATASAPAPAHAHATAPGALGLVGLASGGGAVQQQRAPAAFHTHAHGHAHGHARPQGHAHAHAHDLLDEVDRALLEAMPLDPSARGGGGWRPEQHAPHPAVHKWQARPSGGPGAAASCAHQTAPAWPDGAAASTPPTCGTPPMGGSSYGHGYDVRAAITAALAEAAAAQAGAAASGAQLHAARMEGGASVPAPGAVWELVEPPTWWGGPGAGGTTFGWGGAGMAAVAVTAPPDARALLLGALGDSAAPGGGDRGWKWLERRASHRWYGRKTSSCCEFPSRDLDATTGEGASNWQSVEGPPAEPAAASAAKAPADVPTGGAAGGAGSWAAGQEGGSAGGAQGWGVGGGAGGVEGPVRSSAPQLHGAKRQLQRPPSQAAEVERSPSFTVSLSVIPPRALRQPAAAHSAAATTTTTAPTFTSSTAQITVSSQQHLTAAVAHIHLPAANSAHRAHSASGHPQPRPSSDPRPERPVDGEALWGGESTTPWVLLPASDQVPSPGGRTAEEEVLPPLPPGAAATAPAGSQPLLAPGSVRRTTSASADWLHEQYLQAYLQGGPASITSGPSSMLGSSSNAASRPAVQRGAPAGLLTHGSVGSSGLAAAGSAPPAAGLAGAAAATARALKAPAGVLALPTHGPRSPGGAQAASGPSSGSGPNSGGPLTPAPTHGSSPGASLTQGWPFAQQAPHRTSTSGPTGFRGDSAPMPSGPPGRSDSLGAAAAAARAGPGPVAPSHGRLTRVSQSEPGLPSSSAPSQQGAAGRAGWPGAPPARSGSDCGNGGGGGGLQRSQSDEVALMARAFAPLPPAASTAILRPGSGGAAALAAVAAAPSQPPPLPPGALVQPGWRGLVVPSRAAWRQLQHYASLQLGPRARPAPTLLHTIEDNEETHAAATGGSGTGLKHPPGQLRGMVLAPGAASAGSAPGSGLHALQPTGAPAHAVEPGAPRAAASAPIAGGGAAGSMPGAEPGGLRWSAPPAALALGEVPGRVGGGGAAGVPGAAPPGSSAGACGPQAAGGGSSGPWAGVFRRPSGAAGGSHTIIVSTSACGHLEGCDYASSSMAVTTSDSRSVPAWGPAGTVPLSGTTASDAARDGSSAHSGYGGPWTLAAGGSALPAGEALRQGAQSANAAGHGVLQLPGVDSTHSTHSAHSHSRSAFATNSAPGDVALAAAVAATSPSAAAAVGTEACSDTPLPKLSTHGTLGTLRMDMSSPPDDGAAGHVPWSASTARVAPLLASPGLLALAGAPPHGASSSAQAGRAGSRRSVRRTSTSSRLQQLLNSHTEMHAIRVAEECGLLMHAPPGGGGEPGGGPRLATSMDGTEAWPTLMAQSPAAAAAAAAAAGRALDAGGDGSDELPGLPGLPGLSGSCALPLPLHRSSPPYASITAAHLLSRAASSLEGGSGTVLPAAPPGAALPPPAAPASNPSAAAAGAAAAGGVAPAAPAAACAGGEAAAGAVGARLGASGAARCGPDAPPTLAAAVGSLVPGSAAVAATAAATASSTPFAATGNSTASTRRTSFALEGAGPAAGSSRPATARGVLRPGGAVSSVAARRSSSIAAIAALPPAWHKVHAVVLPAHTITATAAAAAGAGQGQAAAEPGAAAAAVAAAAAAAGGEGARVADGSNPLLASLGSSRVLGDSEASNAAGGGAAARAPLTLAVTQVDVSQEVAAQAQLSSLLQKEHKVLESIFPRHVIEYVALSQGRGGNNNGLGSGALHAAAGGGVAGGGAALQGGLERLASLATFHPNVTVLFCDIVGFTEFCGASNPFTIMAFLNNLYSRLDGLVDIYKVYKVETIGDCYMVAGGLVAYDEDGYKSVISGAEDPLHAVRVMEFAKAMLRVAREVYMPHTTQHVRLRIGLHSGPVTSGVVGERMPRFCLFGDTVNVASRMESTCRPGRIHVSAATRVLLQKEQWHDCGLTAVKGKGDMRTFEWSGDGESPLPEGQLQRMLGLL